MSDTELTPPVKADPATAWLVLEGLPSFALVVQNTDSVSLIRKAWDSLVQEFQHRVDGLYG